jgi:anti-sigma regulatory factor (Ser/Thr protein kinase)
MDLLEARKIAKLIEADDQNVSARVAESSNISRQSASTRLATLKKLGYIASTGTGRGVRYTLLPIAFDAKVYERDGLDEDRVWREQCLPLVRGFPKNVQDIWHHGITEMVNNAIDHSGSDQVKVNIGSTLTSTRCIISDQGEGIFLKIQKALNLYDPREAILELAKGKFTTDPANHSGEGIFFSSKMFDEFVIRSGELSFCHFGTNGEDVLLTAEKPTAGTSVSMSLANDSKVTAKEIFDKFAMPEELSFAKTIVPVKLALYEGDKLVSRSQAKRLTRRFERFQTVIVDFEGVETIGQAFADEVFRVFKNAHPDLKMVPVNTSKEVKAMIKRVTTT